MSSNSDNSNSFMITNHFLEETNLIEEYVKFVDVTQK